MNMKFQWDKKSKKDNELIIYFSTITYQISSLHSNILMIIICGIQLNHALI